MEYWIDRGHRDAGRGRSVHWKSQEKLQAGQHWITALSCGAFNRKKGVQGQWFGQVWVLSAKEVPGVAADTWSGRGCGMINTSQTSLEIVLVTSSTRKETERKNVQWLGITFKH